MDTQTLLIVATLVLGFVAMTLVLKKPASQDASIAALTGALNQAQQQMATLMEQRIGTADQNFTNQVASVQRQLEALATQTRELEQIRQGAVSTLTQMTGDTKQAVDRLNAETAILTGALSGTQTRGRSEEHTPELQSH